MSGVQIAFIVSSFFQCLRKISESASRTKYHGLEHSRSSLQKIFTIKAEANANCLFSLNLWCSCVLINQYGIDDRFLGLHPALTSTPPPLLPLLLSVAPQVRIGANRDRIMDELLSRYLLHATSAHESWNLQEIG